jgi:Protein of unknown function (DUF664)
MDPDGTPWEPPLAGTETEHLLGAIDRMRATFRWKADALGPAALAVTVGASSLTLGGLLKHLALAEDHHSTVKLTGRPLGPPWDGVDWDAEPDWDFASAVGDAPADLYAAYDGAVARARERIAAVLADGGLDQPADVSTADGHHASVRRLLFDLLEEYGRHTGHADLLREAVDGRVGEDPPAGWRPSPG